MRESVDCMQGLEPRLLRLQKQAFISPLYYKIPKTW